MSMVHAHKKVGSALTLEAVDRQPGVRAIYYHCGVMLLHVSLRRNNNDLRGPFVKLIIEHDVLLLRTSDVGIGPIYF